MVCGVVVAEANNLRGSSTGMVMVAMDNTQLVSKTFESAYYMHAKCKVSTRLGFIGWANGRLVFNA